MSAVAAPPAPSESTGRLLTVRQVADLLAVHPRTVWRLAASDEQFPKPVRVGEGSTRWRASEVTAYVDSLASS
jgi:predicted DNA-binding transcriptional regulator AlpA